jgi:fluoroquinolone resistance protein
MEFYDQLFSKENYTITPLTKGEYEQCKFDGCNFNNCDLSNFKFIQCTFTNCDLSLVKLDKTILQDAVFKDCKMLGLHFYKCNEFALSFQFTNCQLNHSSFFNTKIKNTKFVNCQLKECDLTQADLTSALFDNCDLLDAHFENTNLEKADLRTSFNYQLAPELNKIKKAKFTLNGLPGLLSHYGIIIE